MAAKVRVALVIMLLLCCAASAALATPTGVSVSINQGDSSTTSDVVFLYMTASTSNPPLQVRFSNWGFGISSQWETYFQKKMWMLEPAGTLYATKGVTVEFKDATGTVSASDSIFVVSPLNPNVLAQKRWHYSNLSGNSISLTGGPTGICFDGLNMWVAKYTDNYLAKIRAPDATIISSVSYTTGAYPIDVVSDGRYVWSVNYVGDSVTKRELDGSLIGTYAVGDQPHRACFDGTYIWVGCAGDDKLYRIHANTNVVESSAVIGDYPQGIAFDGNYLWVAMKYDDVVKKIRPSDYAVIGTYPVGTEPEAVLFDGANIWVTNRGDNTVTKLRAVDGANKGTFAVGTQPIGIAFDGAVIWVANWGSATVSKLRAADGTPWGTVSVPGSPWDLAFDGANVWVACYGAEAVLKL